MDQILCVLSFALKTISCHLGFLIVLFQLFSIAEQMGWGRQGKHLAPKAHCQYTEKLRDLRFGVCYGYCEGFKCHLSSLGMRAWCVHAVWRRQVGRLPTLSSGLCRWRLRVKTLRGFTWQTISMSQVVRPRQDTPGHQHLSCYPRWPCCQPNMRVMNFSWSFLERRANDFQVLKAFFELQPSFLFVFSADDCNSLFFSLCEGII